MSRIAAVGLGLGAGLAAVIFLSVNWDQAAAWIGLGNAGAGINPEARLAWTVAGGVAAFAAVALIGALIGGLVEAFLAHSRIAALRYDLTLIDTWTAADWRAAFAETAVADCADAIVATPSAAAAAGTTDRRIAADPTLLATLDRIWLRRLMLSPIILPLPLLVLGAGIALALFRSAGGNPGWEAVLAAGVSGWLAIKTLDYLVRLLLKPAVERTVSAATAAIRPLTLRPGPETKAARAPFEPNGAPSIDSEALQRFDATMEAAAARIAAAADQLAATVAGIKGEFGGQVRALAEQAGQIGGAATAAPLAAIADGIRNAVHQREQAIESVLAEVRASIEQLLAGTSSPGAGDAALRQMSEEFKAGAQQIVASLNAAVSAIERTSNRQF